jgi:hypothetical protein
VLPMIADSDVEMLVPLFGIFFLFGAPIIAFTVFRLLAHRERMEMIRQGFDPGVGRGSFKEWPRMQPGARQFSAQSYVNDSTTTLRKGITVAAVGFALTIGLSFIGYHETALGTTIHPGPWLLGGLIPLFVGLAQIFIALGTGAALRPTQTAQAFEVPPPGVANAADVAAGPAPTYPGSYTYRPGASPELRPPAPPPTQRDN